MHISSSASSFVCSSSNSSPGAQHVAHAVLVEAEKHPASRFSPFSFECFCPPCPSVLTIKKYITALIVAASAAFHVQSAELESQLPGYAQAGGAKIEVKGGDKAPAAGKLEDISAQPIPDKPAAGKVHGREFKVEKATLEEGSLKLRQGAGFASHLEEFEIDLSRKKVENFAGQTFTVELNQKADIDITLAYSGEKKGSIKTRTYMGSYSMKLEFGTAKDGKLAGKIHLRLPDEARSFVVGTFEAEMK